MTLTLERPTAAPEVDIPELCPCPCHRGGLAPHGSVICTTCGERAWSSDGTCEFFAFDNDPE